MLLTSDDNIGYPSLQPAMVERGFGGTNPFDTENRENMYLHPHLEPKSDEVMDSGSSLHGAETATNSSPPQSPNPSSKTERNISNLHGSTHSQQGSPMGGRHPSTSHSHFSAIYLPYDDPRSLLEHGYSQGRQADQ